MTDKLFVLLLLRTVFTTQIPQKIPLRIVKISETITLRCPGMKGGTDILYWYKQCLGHMPQIISFSTFGTTNFQGQFNNSRFIVNKSGAEYPLTIRNVSKDDEATYFCGKGSSYSMEYGNGTYLVVNESDHERSIRQTLVPLGDRVTLKCWITSGSREDQCIGGQSGHNVFWFRNESHPGMVSSHWNRSRGCETEAGSAPQRCVYSLYKDSVLSSDAGMYYCAVAACGEILFGKGVKLDISQKLDPHVIVLVVLVLLLAFCVIALVLLIYTRKQKTVCEHCHGTLNPLAHLGHDQTAVHQSSEQDDDDTVKEVNYAALDFPARKAKGKKRIKKGELNSECIYSGVRLDWQ